MNSNIRKQLLKPMQRRAQANAHADLVARAMDSLDARAIGEQQLDQLRPIIDLLKKERDRGKRRPRSIRSRVLIESAKVLFACRRISTCEYVFHAGMHTENISEDLWLSGAYDSELDPIDREIQRIKRAHGLKDTEDFTLKGAPSAYGELNRQYESVLSNKHLEVLYRYNLYDVGDLKLLEPSEYRRLYERGRRAVFHQDETIPALRDLVIGFEDEARRAAQVGAYMAAVTAIGSAAEGLMTIRCLRAPKKAERVARALTHGPDSPKRPTTWTFNHLIEVCLEAGWLPPFQGQVAVYDPSGVAHLLREMRNLIHPGKLVRKSAWVELDRRDYDDASAMYTVLTASLK